MLLVQPLEDIAEEQQEEEEDGDIGDDDEMADFIVDEEEVDEHGAPVRWISTWEICVWNQFCLFDFLITCVNYVVDWWVMM